MPKRNDTFAQKDQRVALEISAALGSAIRKYTKENGIKLGWLAAEIGTTSSFISKMLNGSNIINLRFLDRIQNALGVNIEIKVGEHVVNTQHVSRLRLINPNNESVYILDK